MTISKQRGTLQGHASVARRDAPAGTRDISGAVERCEPLAAALATSVAIALDPQSLGTPPEPPPATPSAASEHPASTTVVVVREHDTAPPPAPPKPAPANKDEHVVVLGAAGAVTSAALAPAPTIGPELGVIVRLGFLSLEGAARLETMLGEARTASGDRIDASVYSGSLVPCAHIGDFAGCAFGRAGALQGHAPDVVRPSLGTSVFGAVGMRAAYTLRISSRLGVRGAVEAGLPLVRVSLDINGTSVWTSPPAFVSGSLAAVMQFL